MSDRTDVKDLTPALMLDVEKLAPEQAVAQLIERAVRLPASDLFLVCNEQHVAVHVRRLGVVRPLSVVSPDQGRRLISHIKASAGMDVSEHRRPLDGRWIYDDGPDGMVDLRINMIPTLHGEDLSIRLLARESQLFGLDRLGMTGRQLDHLQTALASPSGLILMTGPTGSGKTATLYACLARLNDGKRKINTIEDPIEYAIDGLRQSQINASIELGFSELLRGVLRQSPDVIMIGEVRDAETAHTAVRAANSGHLVFATIHAPTAAGAVQSMRSFGVHAHFLAAGLRAIVAQRLVRTLCPKCKLTFDLSDAPVTFEEVRPWLNAGEGNTLFAPKGCAECNMSGYDARTGVFEVMPISRSLRNLISDGGGTADLRARAIEEGMLEFRQAALLKVAQGKTSTEEIFRVIPSEHLVAGE